MSKWWRAAATTAGVQRSTASARRRSYFTIQAIPREVTGSRVSSRDRAQGRIPAVVFSQNCVQSKPNDPTSIVAGGSVSRKFLLTTERKQIKAIIDSIDLPFFYSTTFPLQIRAGSGSSTLLESGKVLPIKIHRDEETGKILNLVFVWAEDGTKLKVDVPVVFKGEHECPGLKKGGYLNKIRPTLKFLCPAEHIRQKIEIDISQLDVEDKVSLHDIDVHPTWKLLSKNEAIPVCKIKATVDR
ncbi:50S ribosomal protein L25 [Capsicum annuum]|uniref:50S ribosomal protein L25 n=1 Tax=Capsicum annuum TaxID=4072 RepID=UPI0007BF5E1A|nr:50S ribosomal protein L25 [Capsicum annuum]